MSIVGVPESIEDISKGWVCDSELTFELLRYGLEENISGFTLAGIRVPPPLFAKDMSQSPEPGDVVQLLAFEDRLLGRIASLSANLGVMERIWAYVEKSHPERIRSLASPNEWFSTTRALSALTYALLERELEASLSHLRSLLERRAATC